MFAVPPGWPSAIGNPADADLNDEEVAEVSRQLTENIIPAFVAELDSLAKLPCSSHELTQEMHAAGVCVCVAVICASVLAI